MTRPPRNSRRAYDADGKEIAPMTLANMRAHGVLSIAAHCERTACGRTAVGNVDGLADTLPVPDVALKLRCSECDGRRIKTIPNWLEYNTPGVGR
jgi:hypothetical protein